VTEEEEGEAAREGGVGGWGGQGGWARWVVTAGGGGRSIQQGWRALSCGVLGGMLVICRRELLLAMAFYSAASAAGSRHFREKW